MPLRFLFLCAAALAMLLAPLGMRDGAAMAMTHQPVAEASAHAGHCGGTEAPEGQDQPDAMVSCVSACSAIGAVEPLVEPRVKLEIARVAVAESQILVGVHPKGETPPPRIAPET